MTSQPVTYGITWADIPKPFLAILFQAIPFLLLGALLSALLEKALPKGAISGFVKKIGALRYPLCAAAGIAFPVCECAALPITRMLYRRGVPISCCVIFLLASPAVNPLALVSTWAAFQNQHPFTTAALRALSVITLALMAGALTSLHKTRNILTPLSAKNSLQSKQFDPPASWSAALQRAIIEFLDTACYLVMGAALAAILTSGLNRAILFELGQHTSISIFTMMAASFTLSLCSSSDAFIVAPLVGIPWAAKLSFLILGPLIDIKLLVLYSSFFQKTFLLKITTLSFVGTFILSNIIAVAVFFP